MNEIGNEDSNAALGQCIDNAMM